MKVIGWILIVLGGFGIIGVTTSLRGYRSATEPILLSVVYVSLCSLGYWLTRRGKTRPKS